MPLKVPYFRQTTDYFCGPACAQMIFEYYGKKRSQNYLANMLRTNSMYGTNKSDLAKIAKEGGFLVINKPKGTISDIKKFLSSGMPVIVHFIEPSDNEGHYAVVTDIKPKKVVIHDPWNGKDMSLRLADFNKRWRKASFKGPRGGKWLMAIGKNSKA